MIRDIFNCFDIFAVVQSIFQFFSILTTSNIHMRFATETERILEEKKKKKEEEEEKTFPLLNES